MNPFSAMYCYMYRGSQKSGGSYNPQGSANLVLSVVCTLLVMAVMFLLMVISDDFGDAVEKFVRRNLGMKSGRSIGVMLGSALILIFYPMISYTVGTNRSYAKIIDRYVEMDETMQNKVTGNAAKLLYGSIGLFFLSFILAAIFLS